MGMNNDVSTKSNGLMSDYKNKSSGRDQQVEKMAQTAGEQVGAMAADFAHSTSETMKVSRDYVKENPVKGVALAAATGLVVGSLLTIALRPRRRD